MEETELVKRAENAEIALAESMMRLADKSAMLLAIKQWMEGCDGVVRNGLIDDSHQQFIRSITTDADKDAANESQEKLAFNLFWDAYPRKVAKPKAAVRFKSMGCAAVIQQILASIAEQKKTSQWLKDDGEFIPHPTTWLNQRRWEDQKQTKPELDYTKWKQ